MRAAQDKPHPRTVGLDRKCRLCDGAIYFNYRGPVQGVCGRCVDLIRSSTATSTGSVQGCPEYRQGRSPWASIFVFVLGLGAGAAAVPFLGPYLPF